jgi:hypothetical protein
MDPHFGATGDSRSASNLIGPNEETTTWDENGNLLDRNDLEKKIDPMECRVRNPEPVPDPPPDPPIEEPPKKPET